MLAGKGTSTNILYNALIKEYIISAIILEEPIDKKTFLQNRIKKLGLMKVFGQILFQLLVVNFFNLSSSKRNKEILHEYGLDDSQISGEKIIRIKSVNDNNCLNSLQKLAPDVVIVNGTRIISKKLLNSIKATFINMHVGITPKYRGVHGGYWALVNDDDENFGVTIHLVDAGVDTGSILYQKNISVTGKDNFVTYPFLQLAEGIPLMKKGLKDILNDTVIKKSGTKESSLWYHPSIWQYLYYRLTKAIK